ncbi:hypothetical protein Agub_g15966, partial [Astrephomene gubernaculifera]
MKRRTEDVWRRKAISKKAKKNGRRPIAIYEDDEEEEEEELSYQPKRRTTERGRMAPANEARQQRHVTAAEPPGLYSRPALFRTAWDSPSSHQLSLAAMDVDSDQEDGYGTPPPAPRQRYQRQQLPQPAQRQQPQRQPLSPPPPPQRQQQQPTPPPQLRPHPQPVQNHQQRQQQAPPPPLPQQQRQQPQPPLQTQEEPLQDHWQRPPRSPPPPPQRQQQQPTPPPQLRPHPQPVQNQRQPAPPPPPPQRQPPLPPQQQRQQQQPPPPGQMAGPRPPPNAVQQAAWVRGRRQRPAQQRGKDPGPPPIPFPCDRVPGDTKWYQFGRVRSVGEGGDEVESEDEGAGSGGRKAKLPSNVPLLCWPSHVVKKKKFGLLAILKKIPAQMPVGKELNHYEWWCTEAFDFTVAEFTQAKKETWNGILNTVSKFLGFCRFVECVPPKFISLRLAGNPTLVIRYLDFMMMRCAAAHLGTEVCRLKRLVVYLESYDPTLTDKEREKLMDMVEWLKRISDSFRRSYPTPAPPPSDVDSDEEDEDGPTGLPDKVLLLRFVMELRQKADDALSADMVAGDISFETALLQRDALLAEFLCGLYVPPLRLACIATLKVPGRDVCTHACCSRANCRGNTLRALTTRSGEPTGGMKVELFHHKTERFRKKPITFKLPKVLAERALSYINNIRPILAGDDDTDEEGEETAPVPFLFLTGRGKALGISGGTTVAALWNRIQQQHSAPWQPFTARLFRHIHANSEFNAVIREVAAGRTHLDGDAQIMGNSQAAWDSNYIKDHDSAMMQATVDRLEDWRLICEQKLRRQGSGGSGEEERPRDAAAAAGEAQPQGHEVAAGKTPPEAAAGAPEGQEQQLQGTDAPQGQVPQPGEAAAAAEGQEQELGEAAVVAEGQEQEPGEAAAAAEGRGQEPGEAAAAVQGGEQQPQDVAAAIGERFQQQLAEPRGRPSHAPAPRPLLGRLRRLFMGSSAEADAAQAARRPQGADGFHGQPSSTASGMGPNPQSAAGGSSLEGGFGDLAGGDGGLDAGARRQQELGAASGQGDANMDGSMHGGYGAYNAYHEGGDGEFADAEDGQGP